MAEHRIPIVVGEDGTYTRATSETFRKIAEGQAINAEAIIWVPLADVARLLSGVIYVSLGYLPNPRHPGNQRVLA